MSDDPRPNGNSAPTMQTVRAKASRPGALFALDEVFVLIDALDFAYEQLAVVERRVMRLERQRDHYISELAKRITTNA